MTRKKSKPSESEPPIDRDQPQYEQEPQDKAPQTPEEQAGELLARLQRLSADYLNYQKRASRDLAQARLFANEELIKSLLPTLDDMERALEAARSNHDSDDPLLAGMQLVHDKTLETLGRFGLTPIDAANQSFDPQHHTALMQQPSETCEPGTVLQMVQKGYELKGRVIRPAGVVVSRAPDDPSDQENQPADAPTDQGDSADADL